jgi:hypothetical protein
LARRIARGSTVVFLTHNVFAKNNRPTAWLPLANKGSLVVLPNWLYHKDEWCKRHPVFDGLPAHGLMDYTYYREIIPDLVWVGQDAPAEAVAGGINACLAYSSGLLVAVYELGAGRFILNSLRIRENLGRDPVAERLLRNMLRYVTRDLAKPVANLPPDFDKTLDSFGYPTVEWTLYFKNEGTTDTPLLESLQALDTTFQRGAEGDGVEKRDRSNY